MTIEALRAKHLAISEELQQLEAEIAKAKRVRAARSIFWDRQEDGLFVYLVADCQIKEARLRLPHWRVVEYSQGQVTFFLHDKAGTIELNYAEDYDYGSDGTQYLGIEWGTEWRYCDFSSLEEGEQSLLIYLDKEVDRLPPGNEKLKRLQSFRQSLERRLATVQPNS